MLLPELFLASRAGILEYNSGIDCLKECLDKAYYRTYPHKVSYQFNSRGFRDREWTGDLQSAIWCLGDSFTVGLGSPVAHTWTAQVELTCGFPTINVSLDGVSNDWIARQACNIIRTVQPRNMIIMWSYLHRREDPNSELSDEDRRLFYLRSEDKRFDSDGYSSEIEDQLNFQSCVKSVDGSSTNIVHFIIPCAYDKGCSNNTAKDWLPDYIKEVPRLDLARDSHHFDILTSQWVAQQAASGLIL